MNVMGSILRVRVLVLGGAVPVILVALVLAGLGMPLSYAFALGFLAVGVGGVRMGQHVFSTPVRVLGCVLSALGVLSLAHAVGGSLRVSGVLVGVVLVVAGLVIAHLLRTGYRLSARRWRAGERRVLAAERGWRFQDTDAGLAAELGDSWYQTRPAGVMVATEHGVIPPSVRAHAVLRGEIGGVAFAAFDYARGRHPLFVAPVATACVVRLPRRLPLFTSVEVFRHDGDQRAPSATTAAPHVADVSVRANDTAPPDRPDPAYARALLTPRVSALTSEEFPSWWITDSTLATVTRNRHGLPADTLVRIIEEVTRLASLLNWTDLAPHTIVGGPSPVWEAWTDES